MIWHKLDPSRCRWIVYSGESVPAGRRERWRLAYCSHPLLQQGGFTHLCLWVLTVRISDLLWIFHSESLMSVWWLLLWSFTLFVPYFWCVGRIVFSAGEALWIEPRGVCVFALLCGRLPVTISFMHIRGASPLIFFMFSHSPQPATRYVSMSVCLGAHTLPCLSPFRSFTPSVRKFVLRSPADSKSGVNVLSALTPLFSNPYPVPVVSCLTNSNFPLSFLTWCASSSVDSEYSLVCWNRYFSGMSCVIFDCLDSVFNPVCVFVCDCSAEAQYERRGPGSVRWEDCRCERRRLRHGPVAPLWYTARKLQLRRAGQANQQQEVSLSFFQLCVFLFFSISTPVFSMKDSNTS